MAPTNEKTLMCSMRRATRECMHDDGTGISALTKMPRNNNLFLHSDKWSNSTGKWDFRVGVEADAAKDEIIVEQGYPNPSTSRIKLINRTKQSNQDGYKHQLCCYYHTEKRGGCKWAAQESYDNELNVVCFCVGNVPHSEHMMSANVKARVLINSPSELRQTPGEFRHWYMKDHPDADHVELKTIGETF
jgi:hypothetical protein